MYLLFKSVGFIRVTPENFAVSLPLSQRMSEKTVDTESATVPPSSTELPASDDIGFPEGGWQAWSTALGAYVIGSYYLYSLGLTSCIIRSLVQFTSFG